MHLTTISADAEAEPWDPANPGPFTVLLGGQFLAVDGDRAVYRDQDGAVGHARPGWIGYRLAGETGAHVMSPDNLGKIWRVTEAA